MEIVRMIKGDVWWLGKTLAQSFIFYIQRMIFFNYIDKNLKVGEGVDTLSYKGTFNQTKSFTPNIYFLLNVFCLWWFAFRIDSKLGAC